MKKTILIITVIWACALFKAQSQIYPPLKIGDKMPESVWNKPMQIANNPGKMQTITLNKYKGKLIILDFWATWCTACIQNMPRLDSLQKAMGETFTILPLSYQPKAIVENFIRRNKILRDLHLFSVVQDSTFNQLFPHRLIPHYVWIDGGGTVISFTSADEINVESVNKVLNGLPPEMQQKNDQDVNRPLFASSELPEKQLSFYSLLLKGNFPGFGTGVNYRQTGDTVYGVLLTNSSLLYIYKIAARTLLPNNADKRIIVEVEHPDKLYRRSTPDPLWNKENLYTYEIRVPLVRAKVLYPLMLDHLNQVTGFCGTIEKRDIKCLVLESMPGYDRKVTNGAKFLNSYDENGNLKISNAPTLALTGRLNNVLSELVIDETHVLHNIDINIHLKPNDLKAIQTELEHIGYRLSEVTRSVEVLILRESD